MDTIGPSRGQRTDGSAKNGYIPTGPSRSRQVLNDKRMLPTGPPNNGHDRVVMRGECTDGSAKKRIHTDGSITLGWCKITDEAGGEGTVRDMGRRGGWGGMHCFRCGCSRGCGAYPDVPGGQ